MHRFVCCYHARVSLIKLSPFKFNELSVEGDDDADDDYSLLILWCLILDFIYVYMGDQTEIGELFSIDVPHVLPKNLSNIRIESVYSLLETHAR